MRHPSEPQLEKTSRKRSQFARSVISFLTKVNLNFVARRGRRSPDSPHTQDQNTQDPLAFLSIRVAPSRTVSRTILQQRRSQDGPSIRLPSGRIR
jgi:hypothetical protein